MNKRTLRALRAALIGILIMSLFASTALAASSVSAKINAKTKIYQTPSKSARTATVKSGLKVKLVAASNDWGKITYKGQTAYIPLKYLTLTSPYKAYTASEAVVYKKAGSTKLGTLSPGTTVYVVGLTGKYARVKKSKSSSSIGYIRTNDLTKNKVYTSNGGTTEVSLSSTGTYSSSSGTSTNMPSSLRSTTTSASVSKIEYTIYVAQNLIGAPYKESSKPPTSFDCATFTKWCYGKAKSGSVSGSAKSQGYDTRYTMISNVADLERGDLVCFDTVVDSDLSDHVGIYLGGGYFIHASSVAKMVVVSNLNSGYYNRVFSWGRRIFYD
ncbi:MAG: C40 family peptidase [Clostridia bacterium]|nr:C40 family peptidase [Clostridia bacterium]